MKDKILFSASQLEAIRCDARVCEVIAGPGSGKTAVLTRHILYLIKQTHVPPDRILVLTFSRAAALQMQQRFYKEAKECDAGEGAFLVTFGTFHSFFYSILKNYSNDKANLISASDRSALLKRLTAEYYPDETDRPLPEEIERFLSLRGVKVRSSVKQDDRMEQLAVSYRSYLEENGLLDFDMILVKTDRYLRSHPALVIQLREKYSCIIADEMQDIDNLQYSMLRLLSEGGFLYTVGDDDQSIYGFRGSDPGFMRRFPSDFPGCHVLYLRENYRCASRIVEASQKIISRNKNRIHKEIVPVRTGGEVILIPCGNESEEMRHAAKYLKENFREGQSSAAVICRTNRQVYAFQKELEAVLPGISGTEEHSLSAPGMKKLHREITEDLRSYAALAQQIKSGKLQRKALMRILNRPPRYLMRSTAGLDSSASPESLLTALAEHPETQRILKDLFSDFHSLSEMKPVFFCRYLLESMGYGDYIRALSPLYGEPLLEILQQEAALAGNTEEWFRSWEKVCNREAEADQSSQGKPAKKSSSQKSLHVMTMHACKGLEFDTVLIPGLNEGLIPSRRSTTEEALEEERRLLYVAMTRAKSRLVLLFSVGTDRNPRLPSRFLIPLGIKMQGLNTKTKYGKIFSPNRK